jgi:hypothetical protein
MRPAFDAGIALTRLDERIARSPVGAGFLERTQFTDACASLWIDGELVHLEDLVLHDATRDIRTPTHELTIARDVLRTRRRIAAASPRMGACPPTGFRTLRKRRRSIRPALRRRDGQLSFGPRSRSIRKGRGTMPTTSKIYPASTMPPSMRCWPDRSRDRERNAARPRSGGQKRTAGL